MTFDEITHTIDRALAAAGLDTGAGMPRSVMQTIRQALGKAGVEPDAGPAAAPAAPAPGRMLSFEHAGARGRRAYRLYVPRAHDAGRALPLVVMLHGCRQDPEDFARGTRMNALAEEHGFLVAWPAQSPKANGSNCWRWFEPSQQARGGAEPSIIAGIVAEVAGGYRVDRRRVYAAGLSAGAAMAVILGETYPEVFAAVAAHSGLPRGAAHDVASAFAAMREGAAAARAGGRARPTIVLHGEADATVAPANGAAIVQRALAGLAEDHGELVVDPWQGIANGRRCTRLRHHDRDGRVLVEHWSVQGAGHSWFGGSTEGSFAGPEGPDASREIVRFFARQVLKD